jgi:hypothetical protein
MTMDLDAFFAYMFFCRFYLGDGAEVLTDLGLLAHDMKLSLFCRRLKSKQGDLSLEHFTDSGGTRQLLRPAETAARLFQLPKFLVELTQRRR